MKLRKNRFLAGVLSMVMVLTAVVSSSSAVFAAETPKQSKTDRVGYVDVNLGTAYASSQSYKEKTANRLNGVFSSSGKSVTAEMKTFDLSNAVPEGSTVYNVKVKVGKTEVSTPMTNFYIRVKNDEETGWTYIAKPTRDGTYGETAAFYNNDVCQNWYLSFSCDRIRINPLGDAVTLKDVTLRIEYVY